MAAPTERYDDRAPEGEEFRIRAEARSARARKALPPDVVRRLSELSPFRSTLSVVETWGTVFAAVYVAHRFPHPAVIAAAILVVASRQHALAILVHQAAHYRLYKTRWLNDLVGRICAFPLSTSMVTYRVIHRIHHNSLYAPIDPDLALMAGYPRGRLYLLRKLAKDLFGLTVVKNYLYFFGKPPAPKHAEGSAPRDDTSPALKAAARRDRAMTVVIQIAMLALAILTGHLREYLLLWVLPLVTVLQMILRLRAVAEHGAVTDLSSPLTAARTTLASPLVRYFVYPHNMHYHVEHHLYPSVPHYRLPECHREMEAAGALEGAEVVTSFGGTLRKIFADPPAAA